MWVPWGIAQSLMIDMVQRRYVAFLRGAGPTGENRIYSTTEDFVNWSPLQVAMETFGHDSLYNHIGFNYGDTYLGLLTHYFVQKDGVHQLALRLLTSRDGLTYRMAQPDTHHTPPLVDTGPIGEGTGSWSCSLAALQFAWGDELYIYYRGYSETHNRGGTKPADSYYAGDNGLATIRVDGFASLAAGFDGGTVTTGPVSFGKSAEDAEPVLKINGKADHHARIGAEILDPDGQPIQGYSAEECVPLTDDRVEHPVRWQNRPHLGEVAERPVRFRFHLVNARLFSYTVA